MLFIKFPLQTDSLHHPRGLAAREGEVISEARLRGEGLVLALLLLRTPRYTVRESTIFSSFCRPAPSEVQVSGLMLTVSLSEAAPTEGRTAGSLNTI